MDHVRLDATRRKPARQPEAVAAGFEGRRNPRNRAAGLDRLILPAMQQAKQPFWVRLLLLARLTLNPGKHAGDEPARLAHLDDGYDRAILVQGDEGPAQVVRLGYRGTPSLDAATKLPFLAARPIASLSVPPVAVSSVSRPLVLAVVHLYVLAPPLYIQIVVGNVIARLGEPDRLAGPPPFS